MRLVGGATVIDLDELDVERVVGARGDDLILVTAVDDRGGVGKLLLSIDAAEALQYALEQVLR